MAWCGKWQLYPLTLFRKINYEQVPFLWSFSPQRLAKPGAFGNCCLSLTFQDRKGEEASLSCVIFKVNP